MLPVCLSVVQSSIALLCACLDDEEEEEEGDEGDDLAPGGRLAASSSSSSGGQGKAADWRELPPTAMLDAQQAVHDVMSTLLEFFQVVRRQCCCCRHC